MCLAIGSCKKSDSNEPCLLTVKIVPFGDLGEYQVVVKDGLAPYKFQWTGGHEHTNLDDSWRVAALDEAVSVTVTDNLGCVASDSLLPPLCGTATIVTDADGNGYNVVSIGNQCWMESNLIVSAGISQVTDSAVWVTTTSPGWCYYDNNPVNAKYGKLYNWYAVQSGKLCPAGWHIPTEADWKQLETFLGNEPGGKMKSTTGWNSPNEGATNSSGFTAVPSGWRSFISSHFTGLGQSTGFWTSTQATDSTSYFHGVSYDSRWLTILPVAKRQGYSCRCVMD